MTAIFSMLPSITDSQTWFYVAGAIGAVALAIGFLAAAASLIFGWRMNAEQKSATQVEIANVESAANERIEIETTKVKSAAEERIAKVESESREKIAGLSSAATGVVPGSRMDGTKRSKYRQSPGYFSYWNWDIDARLSESRPEQASSSGGYYLDSNAGNPTGRFQDHFDGRPVY